MRVVQRSGRRSRTALHCRRIDHHLAVGERGRRVLVPWNEQRRVPPAKAPGEGPGGCEFASLDLAAEATEQARRGACRLRSLAR